MLKFWSVINNCFFMHWKKKLTLVDKVFILVFILFHSPKFSDIWPLDQDSSSRSQGLPLAKLLEKKINKYLCKSRRFISRWIDYVPYIHSYVPQNPFWRSILTYHFHETLFSRNIYENSWKLYISCKKLICIQTIIKIQKWIHPLMIWLGTFFCLLTS